MGLNFENLYGSNTFGYTVLQLKESGLARKGLDLVSRFKLFQTS